MKITCQTCHAKYTVADEKVVGRIAKIKCKKCGSTIVVNGNDPSLLAQSSGAESGYGQPHEDDDGATRVFTESPSNAMSGGASNTEWTVNLSETDQRTMTTSELADGMASGAIPMDTYVWADGMADWSAAADVPELRAAVDARAGGGYARPAAGAPAYSPEPAPSPYSAEHALGGTMMMNEGASPAEHALGGTMMMNEGASPAEHALGGTMMMNEGAPPPAATPFAPAAAAPAAAAPQAARRERSRGAGVDLFGAAAARAEEPPRPPAVNYSGGTGERNENSVLFSLSALTASETAAKSGSNKAQAGMLDLGPPRPARAGNGNNNGRAALDDLMNMGGGGIGAAPVLAPPPLLAPVVEAAPPPPSMAPPALAPVMAPGASPLGPPMPMMRMDEPKKSPLPMILGAVAALGILGAVAFFALSGGKEETPATGPVAQETTAKPAETAAPAATETAAPAATDGAAQPADTAKVAAAEAPAAVDPGKAATPDKGSSASTAAAATAASKTTATPKETAAATPTPPPAETAAAPAEAPAAGGGREFSRSAATSALGAAAGSARSCKKPDGPTGAGKVKVTFAPSGNVTSAQVQGAPFAGTAVGGCVAGVFRGARVPAFDGSPVTVTKSFTIN